MVKTVEAMERRVGGTIPFLKEAVEGNPTLLRWKADRYRMEAPTRGMYNQGDADEGRRSAKV